MGSDFMDTALADLHRFDTKRSAWTAVTATSGQAPTARYSHGFTSLHNMLYVFGGQSGWGGNIASIGFDEHLHIGTSLWITY